MAHRANLILPLLLTIAPSGVFAQETPARRSENPLTGPAATAEEKRSNQLTRPPELLRFVEAAYPKDAEATGLSGSVGLIVDIDATGAVSAVEVTEPAGNGFDEAAVEAVKGFAFSPAEIDGTPAPVRIAYRYHFTLRRPEPAPPPPAEATVNLRGRVLQRGNRAPLASASVAVDDGLFGAVADEKGLFEIRGVPAGRHRVVVTAAGFDRFETEEEIVEGKATEVSYYVRKHVFTPYETVVRGKRERKDVAHVELRQEEIRLVAGTGGDAFKVVQDLPGVARAPYGFGLLIVRGGRPQDTRVYVDGVYIPIMFHFGGLTSVYNSDLLEDLTFLPGNFSAHNGRAMGGVVEAASRTPSKEAWHGYANVNLVDTTLLVEGPLGPDWSVAAAGRVSYVDVVLEQVLPSSVRFMTAPRYWDYQLKAEYAPKGEPDRISLQYFGGHDLMALLLTNAAALDPEGRDNLSASEDFQRLVASWRRRLAPNLSNRLQLAFGTDSGESNLGGDIKGAARLNAFQLREALTWEPLPSLSIEAGTDSYFGWYRSDTTRPQVPIPGQIPDPLMSRQLVHGEERGSIVEPAVYLEGVWKPFEGTKIVPGLRFDYEGTLKYVTLDPRLSIVQEIREGTRLKGAIGVYQQPPDFRMQQWTRTYGNPYLGPERSVQTMIGAEHRLTEALGIDLQLFHKGMTQLMFPSKRTVERDGETVLERYNNAGVGRAYGVEVLLRHELTSRFFGWISYSYSRSERRDTTTTESYWYAQFDQPHHLVAVASYKWPGDVVTGLRFQWASGNLSTPFTSAVYDGDADMYMPIPGERFSVRAPDFVSLDLRIDKRLVFDEWTVNVFLDVQNVTNNTNPEFVLYNYDYSRTQYVPGLPVFPTLGIKAEF